MFGNQRQHHSTRKTNSSRVQATGPPSKQVLRVSADPVLNGVKDTMIQGFVVRVEVGTELKSLTVWGIEVEPEIGASIVIRDGHTLKKKVSWRPSSAAGDHLHATSIVFTPAHQYGTNRCDSHIWTSWSNASDRSDHQFVLFSPITRDAQRCIKYQDMLVASGLHAAAELFSMSRIHSDDRGVKFESERRTVIQPPLAVFCEDTQRVYVLYQTEFKGAIETVLGAITPHPPFTITESCRLPYSWASGCRFAKIGLLTDPQAGSFVLLTTEKLHTMVVSAGSSLQPTRMFRPRDFVNVASNPSQAMEVSMRWCEAEFRDKVILPEYFRDPHSEMDISEPRRFSNAKPPTSSSAASQRSNSVASTVPQRLIAPQPVQPNNKDVVPYPAAVTKQLSSAPPPSAKFLQRAVDALSRMHARLLLSRYLQLWSNKTTKHPNWCIDGWPTQARTAVIALPLQLLTGVENYLHAAAFLRMCSECRVEVWVLYEVSTDLLSILDTLRDLDAHHVIGQFIQAPSLSHLDRQHIYLRHVDSQSILWVMPSVSWMVRAAIFGRGEGEVFTPSKARLYLPNFEDGKRYSRFLNVLGSVIYQCRRCHMGPITEHIWDALRHPQNEASLMMVKECLPNGKGFVDVVSLSLM